MPRHLVLACLLSLAPTARADETVEHGVDLFREHQAAQASRVLALELERGGLEPADDSRARYYLARSLHEMGMVRSAERELVALMERGPDDPYFRHAIPGLLAIARQTGDPSALLELVDRVDPANQPPRAQPSLIYLQGLAAWRRGEPKLARERLERVPTESDLHPRASFVLGTILVEHGHPKQALEAFQAVARAEPVVSDRRERAQLAELRALATLQVARIYEQVDDRDRAERFYAQVERGTSPWEDALEAMARIDLAQGEPTSALERATAASWPAQPGGIPRAAEILHAQALRDLCREHQAGAVLRSFDERALPLWTELAGATATHRSDEGWREPAAAWAAWFEHYPAQSTLTAEVFEHLLQERRLNEAVQRHRLIQAEIQLLDSQDPAWREAVGASLRQRLEADRARCEAEAGAALLDAMEQLEAELETLLMLAEAERGQLLQGAACEGPPPQGEADDPDAWDSHRQPEDHEISWPYTGEIWADEL